MKSSSASCSELTEELAFAQTQIEQLGGVPERQSGIWGTFAKTVEGVATITGVGPALTALETGESHGLKDYQGDLADLSPDVQHFIASKVLPAQEQTYAMVSKLQTEA